MANLRLDLESNATFLADLLSSELSNRLLGEKWGCSEGFVSDRRRKARAGESIVSVQVGTVAADVPPETSNIEDKDDGRHFDFIRHRPVTLEDARALIRSSGDNPDHYNLSIRAIAYGDGKSSNRITAWPKTGMAYLETLDLAQLYKEAGKAHRPATGFGATGRGTVVVISDWQVGKTGRRGGTPELLERITAAREAVARELVERRPERILLLEGGDPIEGFESGGDPQFTNDLSLPDQIDFYATELYKFVSLGASHAPLEVGVVPSNHASWRRGKQQLGLPSDDFGIFAHKQVAKVADAAGMDVQWHYPEPYDESLCVDFMTVPIGLVHGNQYGPGKAIDWWTQQAMGDQAVARADVLIGAHYHSFAAGVAGQNPFTKRERMFLQAPTLDSGSDWYRNIKGRDSLPGTMIFDVTSDGFDLGSLKIL